MFVQLKKFLCFLIGEKPSEEDFLRKSIEASRLSLLRVESEKEYYAAMETYYAKVISIQVRALADAELRASSLEKSVAPVTAHLVNNRGLHG